MTSAECGIPNRGAIDAMVDLDLAEEPEAGSVEAVLFDFGGVLTQPVRDSISAWMAADRIDPTSFSATLKAWLGRAAPVGTPLHRLETGEVSVQEFEAMFADALRTIDGSAILAEGIVGRLFAALELDEEMFLLVEDLKAAGIAVGLLSNSWGNTYPRERLDALMHPVVISGEVGLRKPDAAIYEYALDRLGLPADRVLFIDDAEPNLVGARARGLRTHLHLDAAGTRAVVEGLIREKSEMDEMMSPGVSA